MPRRYRGLRTRRARRPREGAWGTGSRCSRRLPPRADAPTEDERGDESGDATCDVHDGAAREVERAELPEPAAAPDPVRDRVVDERGPEECEDDEGLEALALGERAGDERRRDHREHHLEDHVRLVRNGWCIRTRVLADASECRPVEAADDPSNVRTERERVAPEQP